MAAVNKHTTSFERFSLRDMTNPFTGPPKYTSNVANLLKSLRSRSAAMKLFGRKSSSDLPRVKNTEQAISGNDGEVTHRLTKDLARAESLARVLETQTSFQRGHDDNSWAWIVALYSDEAAFAKAFEEPTAENVIHFPRVGYKPSPLGGISL